jgi:TP901 family phage tail tape measure protein
MAMAYQLLVRARGDSRQLQREFRAAERAVKRTGRQMQNTGRTLTRGITVPLVGLGAAAVKSALDIDGAYAKIRTGTGATGRKLDGLKGSFRTVFRDVPEDAGTVSGAIADLNTRLGLSGKPLEDMTRQMLALSRVTNTDVSANIRTATRVFGDWGVQVGDQAGTLDLMFKASQQTGISLDSLNESLVKYGAPMRQMGFSLEDTTALLSKFEQEGVNSQLVMGSMRIALGKMAKEGITDSSEALRVMTERIKTAGSTGEANALALDMFGARAGPDMAAAIREGRFDIDELTASIAGSGETIMGAAGDAETFGQKVRKLANRLKLALAPLGDELLKLFEDAMPGIERFVGKITNLVEGFSKLNPRTKKIILATAALAAAIGPLLMVTGSLVVSMSGLIAAYKVANGLMLVTRARLAMLAVTKGVATAATGVATAAQWAWNAAITANPIGLIIVAIAAFVAGIVLLWKKHEGFRKLTKKVWAFVKKAVMSAIDEVKRLARELGPKLSKAFRDLWSKAKPILRWVWDAFKKVAAVVIKIYATYLRAMWGAVQKVWSIAKPVLEKLRDAFMWVVDKVKSVIHWLGPKLKPVFEWIRDKGANAITNLQTAFEKMKDVVQAIKNALSSVVDALKWVKDKGSGVLGMLPGVSAGGGNGYGDGAAVGPLAGVDSFTPIAQRFGLVVSPGGAHRPGDPGYHGQNRARDYSNGFGPTPEMLRFAGMMAMIYGRQLKELIYTPLGYGIKNGQRVPLEFCGDRVNQMHNNHVHVAYARGGIVTRPHIGLVGEAGPEAIIPLGNSRQARADRDRLVRQSGLGGGGGDIHVHGITDPVEAASVVARKQRMMRGAVSY